MKEQKRMSELIRSRAKSHLERIGIYPGANVYEVLVEVIALCAERPQLRLHITTELYQEVARKFGKTVAAIECMIRRYISVILYNNRGPEIQQYFGNSVLLNQRNPTAEEFIIAVSEMVAEEPEEVRQIGWHLREIGMSLNSEGYQYFKQAILIVSKDPNKNLAEVYRMIAKNFGTTPGAVKVTMHRARRKTFEDVNKDILQAYFGDTENRLPSTMEFINGIQKKI